MRAVAKDYERNMKQGRFLRFIFCINDGIKEELIRSSVTQQTMFIGFRD